MTELLTIIAGAAFIFSLYKYEATADEMTCPWSTIYDPRWYAAIVLSAIATLIGLYCLTDVYWV